jgi:DNA-binding response OmpR family regulator
MTVTHILVIEDDIPTAEAIAAKVAGSGFTVTVAYTAEAGWQALTDTRPDLIILDVMLPDTNGMDLCRRIRAQDDTPIIMLTARAEEHARIVGLEIGADDYVTKPFSPKELVSRIKAVLRRTTRRQARPAPTLSVYQAAGITLDEERHDVQCDGNTVRLTPTEYKILALLMRHAGHVVSRDAIIEEIWGYDGFSDNLVEIHIGNLRRKIEIDPRRPQRLATVRAFGYKILGELLVLP